MSSLIHNQQQLCNYAEKLRCYFAADAPHPRYTADLALAERWIELLDAPHVEEAAISALLAGLQNNARDGGTASYELDVLIREWAKQRHTRG